MKILYIKNNSERAKEFQLKTIIYEENGQRYVKKQALRKESIPHLKKMKDSYTQLTNSIINPKIKLAKVIDESEDSLTFEFIDGTSLESKYNTAKKLNEKASNKVINAYVDLLKTGFKTTIFDSDTMVTDEYKKLFTDLDFRALDGELCFEGISNIDLIFSNIIYKDEYIYLIDYEWSYMINLPINYIVFRPIHMLPSNAKKLIQQLSLNDKVFHKMERSFVDKYVMQNGFYFQKDNYMHTRLNLVEHVEMQTEHIHNQKLVMLNKESIIKDKEKHIQNQAKLHKLAILNKEVHIEIQDKNLQNKDIEIQQLHAIADSMRIKSRIKRVLKKILPSPIWNLLKKLKDQPDIIEVISTSEILTTYIYQEPQINASIKDQINSFLKKPLISIIMPVYNVDPKWLDLAINSIEDQWYDNWELCLADDKSTNHETIKYLKDLNNPKIKIVFLEKNQNISAASNEALKLTTGEYITLMDNDDELTPDALYEVVKAINIHDADFIYSDEDKLEMDGTFSDPNFKPDFAEDLFLSQNYLSHLGVIKKSLITKVDGFTVGLEGSQDYDLYLKVLEHTDKIHHIEKVLYHWRKIPGSTAAEYGDKSYAQEAGRKALENAMKRREIQATVVNGQTPGTYKVNYSIVATPLISIVIPFKDKPELLTACIESILEKSTYKNFEIIGISNNSTDNATFQEMDRLSTLDKRVSFHEYNVEFNYSKINNYAVDTYVTGEHIIFLNNDIEIITPTWIEEMLMYSQLEQNGAIGAKLYFPNDTIQHAGIVLAPKTIHSAILMYQGFQKHEYGYGSRLKCVNNYAAVTAACLMIKRKLFDQIHGFDAERLSIAYNDVDLCLKAYEAGYKNIWTPYCEAYHHESVSRGYEVDVIALERREQEKWNLKDKHQKLFSNSDPFYNKYLTRFGVGSELDESVTVNYESVNGIPFYEKILVSKRLKSKQHNKVCILSHFDAENEIKEYVIYYLQELSKFMDIIFVSTAEGIKKDSLKSIKTYCRDVIIKKNIGYDFGAWKTGLDYLGSELKDYEELLLCNDSVYGPLFDLENIFKKMQNYDLWSMTDNHEVEYHLQSYFMVYNKKAFTHHLFQDFWENLKIYHNKQILIENNEIGFSQNMMNSNLTYSSYYVAKDKNYVNVLQYYWDDLILNQEFPFMKKELIQKNPLNIKIEHWSNIIQSVSQYDTTLISDTIKS